MAEFINTYLFGIFVPALLLLAGLYYTLLLRGFPFLHPVKTVAHIFSARRTSGDISPFRALALALAGTLGVGNLVGVAGAIWYGGFGAVFWMWVSALAAMILKYAEIVLALLYRKKDSEGRYHGGAMYYITEAFRRLHAHRVGRALAALFALLCVANAVSMGCVIQSNAVAGALEGVVGLSPGIVGGVLALLTVFIIKRGTLGIARFTEALVPLMTLCFILLSSAVLILRREQLPAALALIFRDALRPASAVGGIGGFLLSRALRFGTMRGLVSNEAGCGTAPIAHASSSADDPTAQGVLGIVEVFVDTILLCTMTALVILVSYDGVVEYGEQSILMTIKAFSLVLGPFAEYVMCFAVLCFGFATILCWANYGMECVRYLSRRPLFQDLFVYAYGLFVLIGALSAPGPIWQIADLAIGAMTLINVSVLLGLRRDVKEATQKHLFPALQRTRG